MSIFDLFKKKEKPVKEPDPALEALLRSLERNEIVMEAVENKREIPADASKIGGKPYLPVDFEWPVFTCKDDGVTRPLAFFCQINLLDVADYDKEKLLPKQGMLYFFYECESFSWGFDPEDKGAARVFYYEETEGFIPCSLPEELDAFYLMPEIVLNFSIRKSYPQFEELEVYSDLMCDWDEYDAVLKKLGVDTEENPDRHKLLGYADIIQGEMLTECERAGRGLYSGNPESFQNTPDDVAAEIQECAKEWTLLLQLTTIEKDDFCWMFGDCGMLYFYIRKEDLAEGRFENAWFSMQCG